MSIMTRVGLNWATQIAALALALACGSSKGNDVGPDNSSSASVGGQAPSIGGNGSSNGGGSDKGGSVSSAGSAASANAGNASGTGSSGNTTDGGSGNGGGDGSVGGNGSVGGDNNGLGGDGFGGGSSQDVKLTGGSGNTTDVASGGNGNTVDVATGGGFTIDRASGGGSSIDIATGGGHTIDVTTGGGSSIDVTTGGGTSVDVGTGGGTSTDYPSCIYTDLNSVNVYVITDLTNTGTSVSDCEGNMYVGGNFNSSTGYSIGGVNGVTGDPCAQYSLVVGGNVNGAMVNNGKAVAAGTISNSSANKCGGVVRVPKSQLPVDFAALSSKFQNLSLALAKLPTTAGATATRNAGGALVLKGTDPVQNVFNIDGSQLGTYSVDVPLSSIVIVNVAGTAISWPGGGVTMPGPTGGANGDYLFAANVIWNFPQATSFYMNGLAIDGTVLAPFATFDCTGGGHIAGQVIVYAMNGLSIEFHPYYFSACVKWPKTS
jgi:choice-of-anchor A domain-containing protein